MIGMIPLSNNIAHQYLKMGSEREKEGERERRREREKKVRRAGREREKIYLACYTIHVESSIASNSKNKPIVL